MDANRLNGKTPWRHFAQGTPFYALAMIYNQVLSFTVGILVARFIGASQYGVVSVARNIFDVLGIVSPLGLDLALQRHLGSGPHSTRLAQLTGFRSAAFVLGIAPAVLAALGLGTYVEQSIYRYPEFANILLVTLIALPFATDLAVLGGAYRGVLKPDPSILASYVLQPTFRALVMIALFVLGWRLWAVVVGTSVSYVLSWIMLAVRARRELAPANSTGGFDLADGLSVLRYSPSLAASLVFTTYIRSTDSLFLGHFGSAADVGQYGAVVMVAQLIGLLGLAVGQTLGARIALCYRNNDVAGMEMLLAENLRLTTLFSAPVFAAIVFWGDRIDLVLGPTFAVDASVVSIVAARMLVQTMFGCSGFALSMTGLHLRETGLLGIGLLVSVVLCFALIPSHGQIGAAVAGFISLLMINVTRYAIVRSVFGIKTVKLAAIKPVVWAVAVAGATDLLLRPFDDRTVLFTLFEGVIFAISFAVSAWFMLVTSQDREMVARLFMPRLSIAGADE
ncbi:oligosaccharide flippase family protein [Bradyrhizobium sp. CB82]|uniref:oligosaccharide flippase family protein n=1 Tax=Bradyrhizobium sp. CB82 TaxID=3039159 RepID=UPI0024B06904|nr:oligosaccharide flippase family protein [Bradyrhizobium sp. CB82]WFU38833.1 oligosaccharide flippase family protein [Bradyrhizobium sp. CB82]